MRSLTKARLKHALGYSPFLRLMVFNVWFRSVILVIVVGGLAVALSLPEVWVVSRPGFHPVIRVSALSLAQAWALRQAAARATRLGRNESALMSYRSAVAHNPASLELNRGFFRSALLCPPTPQLSRDVRRQAPWLLRLTRTNLAEVELVARAYDHCRLPEAAIGVLSRHENDLAAPLQALYFKALIDHGQLNRFAERWRAWASRLADTPELGLLRLAYQAGWGTPEQATEARQSLSAVTGASAEQANRILLQLARLRRDPAACEQALRRLRQAKKDQLRDHATLWHVLIDAGRDAEAAQFVDSADQVPVSVAETVALAEVCLRLNLVSRARALLAQSLEADGFAPIVCARYGTLLIQTGDWAGLRALALKIRSRPDLPNSILAFGYFMEGRADLGEGRRETAELAFQRMAAFDFEIPELGLAFAQGLVNVGLVDPAMTALAKLESRMDSAPEFWTIYASAALRQTNLLSVLRATRRLYELEPFDPIVVNNYAMALLVERTDPPTALQLTSSLMARSNVVPAMKVNHAFALLQNDRVQEAKQELDAAPFLALDPAEQTQFCLARFEACARLNLTGDAWLCRDLIQVPLLYPSQQRWLEEAEKVLPPRSVAVPPEP